MYYGILEKIGSCCIYSAHEPQLSNSYVVSDLPLKYSIFHWQFESADSIEISQSLTSLQIHIFIFEGNDHLLPGHEGIAGPNKMYITIL